MAKRNIVIAVIIIVLFIVLALVGYTIVMLNQRIQLARAGVDDDEV